MTLKREMPVTTKFESRLRARRKILKYIELYYNARRMHSSLGHGSPVDHECIAHAKPLENCPI